MKSVKGLYMQFEGLRRTSHIPNLTPLIDIVFLLLVFFMLTSHFVREEVINIDLPEATSGSEANQLDVLEVLISRDGKYLYKDEYITGVKLESLLSSELLNKKDKLVRIKGDSLADLAKVVELIDLSKRSGADSVDIVTVKDAR